MEIVDWLMDNLNPNEIGAGVLSLPLGISKLGEILNIQKIYLIQSIHPNHVCSMKTSKGFLFL